MAKISTLSDEEKDRFNVTGECDFCGGRAEFYWYERECLEYCRDCGMELFPRMLADLADVKKGNYINLYPDQILERFKTVYWRSIAGKCQFEFNSSNSKGDNDGQNEED